MGARGCLLPSDPPLVPPVAGFLRPPFPLILFNCFIAITVAYSLVLFCRFVACPTINTLLLLSSNAVLQDSALMHNPCTIHAPCMHDHASSMYV